LLDLQSLRLKKLKTSLDNQQAMYQLDSGEQLFELNPLVGSTFEIEATGNVFCIYCGRKGKKSYSQGYCYPCSQKLAQCDLCIVRPERCHYDQGTCREPEWGEQNCMIPHTVYLAWNTGFKVGITRSHQKTNRWIDQGALVAAELGQVNTRKRSGTVEIELAKSFSDKSNWRKLLTEMTPSENFETMFDKAQKIAQTHAFFEPSQFEPTHINYPIDEHPPKAISHNLLKNPQLSGKILGIRGQYIITDQGALNIRKHQGFEVNIKIGTPSS
jgi:hypothetical protein